MHVHLVRSAVPRVPAFRISFHIQVYRRRVELGRRIRPELSYGLVLHEC
jgi:hypothetical protein